MKPKKSFLSSIGLEDATAAMINSGNHSRDHAERKPEILEE